METRSFRRHLIAIVAAVMSIPAALLLYRNHDVATPVLASSASGLTLETLTDGVTPFTGEAGPAGTYSVLRAGPSDKSQPDTTDQSTSDEPGTTVNYQGLLRTADGKPANGEYSMVFTIYDKAVPSNQTILYQETQAKVVVAEGLFSAVLGDVTPVDPMDGKQRLTTSDFAATGGVFLGIKVGTDPEMLPRLRFHPVPWAMTILPGAKIAGAKPLANVLDVSGKESNAIHAVSDIHYAVLAEAPSGVAVKGVTKDANKFAIEGINEGGGTAIKASSAGWAMYGNSTGQDAVRGVTGGNGMSGLYGQADKAGYGVYGYSADTAAYGIGVLGMSEKGDGVYGVIKRGPHAAVAGRIDEGGSGWAALFDAMNRGYAAQFKGGDVLVDKELRAQSIKAYHPQGDAVRGDSPTASGLYGQGKNGVYGFVSVERGGGAAILGDGGNRGRSGYFANGDVRVDSNLDVGGNVGVGNELSCNGPFNANSNARVGADLYVEGQASAVRWNSRSDMRVKTDVRPIQDAITGLSHISGYVYKRTDLNMQKDLGVIAQEVQKVFPELVVNESQGDRLLSVNYNGLVAVLVEAAKQLDAANRELGRQNAALQRRNGELETRMDHLEKDLAELKTAINAQPKGVYPSETR